MRSAWPFLLRYSCMPFTANNHLESWFREYDLQHRFLKNGFAIALNALVRQVVKNPHPSLRGLSHSEDISESGPARLAARETLNNILWQRSSLSGDHVSAHSDH